MSNLEIHPRNQILNNLLDIHGQPCGKEVLQRALRHDITMMIGQPGIGKTTTLDQLGDELQQRDVSIEIVRYDDILQETHSSKEGIGFNRRLVRRVLDAFRRRLPEGKVLVDNCGVGDKIPKDRGVTAAENLISGHVPEKPVPTVSTIALVGSVKTQNEQVQRRYQTLLAPSETIVQMYKEQNIFLIGVPQDILEADMGEYIKEAVRHMAQPKHITRIRSEVVAQNMEVIRSQGLKPVLAIQIPLTPEAIDRQNMQFDAAGMEERAKILKVNPDSWITAINMPQTGPITLYASTFLPKTE